MPRYIDADLINWKIIEVPMLDGMMVCTKELDGLYVLKEDVDAIPTADVQEVRRGYWILTDGTTGVCPICNRQDHIDPLAKYCRYCGAKLEVEIEKIH